MSISLESSIRNCKINTGWANRAESARFLDPAMMMCPLWNGLDTAGRPVCRDSFVTLRAGCNSATARTDVENALRPQYFSYIGLNACGLEGAGAATGEHCPVKCQASNASAKNKALSSSTGNFGKQLGAYVQPTCGTSCSKHGQVHDHHNANGTAHAAKTHRQQQAHAASAQGYHMQKAAGN
jgi:hypothetical protein